MANLKCDRCYNEFPITSFPDIGGDGLVCEFCLKGEDADKAQKKLIAKTQEMADRFLDVTTTVELDMPAIKNVMAEVYKNFGGPSGFARKVHWLIEELSKRRPLPASAAQLMINLMKLHETVESNDRTKTLSGMSDAQMERERDAMLIQLGMDAANDPDKRDKLASILKVRGLKIVEASPEEVLGEVIARTEEMT